MNTAAISDTPHALPAAVPVWRQALLPLLLLAALAALPGLLSSWLHDLVLRIVIYTIFALSLELLVGMSGLVSLGHAAFFGIAAYVTVLASPEYEAGNPFTLIGYSMLAAGLYALAVGALSLRTRGVYFIMVTLAFAQMAYFVFHDTKIGGGSDGIFLNVRPVLELGGKTLVDLGNAPHLYYVSIALLAFTYGLLALLRRSRFGHALAGIRVNEQRMRAVGFNTYLCKLAAFVLAALLAALAGFLMAVRNGGVNPEFLSWHESGAVLLMIILGGLGSLRGAVLGAIAFVLLKEFFSSAALLGALAERWQLTLGLTMILFVALLPDGLIGAGRRLKQVLGKRGEA